MDAEAKRALNCVQGIEPALRQPWKHVAALQSAVSHLEALAVSLPSRFLKRLTAL
jgi:hypothetical protein